MFSFIISSNYCIYCNILKKYQLVKSSVAGDLERSGLTAAFYFVCQIFYYGYHDR